MDRVLGCGRAAVMETVTGNRWEPAYRAWRETEAGQTVFALCVRFAREAAGRGRKFGIKMIWERIRWELRITLQKDPAGYRLNNNFHAFVARELVQACPDVAPFIEIRRTTPGRRSASVAIRSMQRTRSRCPATVEPAGPAGGSGTQSRRRERSRPNRERAVLILSTNKERVPMTTVTSEKPLINEAKVPSPTIYEKCVLLGVTLRRIGTRRKVAAGAVEVDADREMLHVGKEILSAPELKAIESLDGDIRRYVASRCVPSEFRSGIYLLNIELINIVDAKLEEFRALRGALIDEFCAMYPVRVEEARGKLRDLFNPMDYPDLIRVRATFAMQTEYLAMSTPDSLESVNKAIFDREKEKAENRLRVAEQSINDVLAAGMKELVDHMVDRLTVDEIDSKPRVFKNTLVTRMTEFFETFPFRNLTGNADLEALVAQAKDVLNGVTPTALRDNRDLRTYVASNMAKVKATLDTMVITKDRAISFDDEEAA